MCYCRSSYCLCCWEFIRTLTTNFCSRVETCSRRTVYSKAFEICQGCYTCRKACSEFSRIPRRWTEKKLDGCFVGVDGFEVDCCGHFVVLASNFMFLQLFITLTIPLQESNLIVSIIMLSCLNCNLMMAIVVC